MLEGLKTFFDHVIHPVPFEYPIDSQGGQRVDYQKWMGRIYTKSQDCTFGLDQRRVDRHDPNYTYQISIQDHRVALIKRFLKEEQQKHV